MIQPAVNIPLISTQLLIYLDQVHIKKKYQIAIFFNLEAQILHRCTYFPMQWTTPQEDQWTTNYSINLRVHHAEIV